MRFHKFPKWLKGLYPKAIWDFFLVDSDDKSIYLTFDDGPTPLVTEWVLDQLKQFDAKATFFCLGNNVQNNTTLYKRIVNEGHKTGSHGMNHINGFKTSSKKYTQNVLETNKNIESILFRPPYGKCTPRQHRLLNAHGYKTVFWSYLSYDFDQSFAKRERQKALIDNLKNGGIIVFHDTQKAYPQLVEDLPLVLSYLSENNFKFKTIS